MKKPNSTANQRCTYCEGSQKDSERIDALEDAMHEINQWAKAYPVSVFPEPDFEKAAQVLKDAGMTIDAISASIIRRVLDRLQETTAFRKLQTANSRPNRTLG